MSTPAKIESLTIGGRIFTDLDNLIIISGFHNAGNSTSGLFLQEDGTQYQVPVGKKLRIWAGVALSIDTTPTANQIDFGYLDVPVALNTNVLGAGTVYCVSSGAYPAATTMNVVAAGNGDFYTRSGFDIKFDMLASKYPFMQGIPGADAVLTLYGYEI